MNPIIREKAEKTVELFKNKGLTCATAESCTGGLIAKLITDIPGSSEVFCGSVVSYANFVKENVLGVSSDTLETYGAVSENTAREMSEGSRKICYADISVSTTGIAGPSGGSAEKPVGTVCFGVSTVKETKAFTKHFDNALTRSEVRHAASLFALDLLIAAASEMLP